MKKPIVVAINLSGERVNELCKDLHAFAQSKGYSVDEFYSACCHIKETAEKLSRAKKVASINKAKK